MKTLTMQEKPTHFPTQQVSGGALKPLSQVLLDRRATTNFKPDPVPEKHLEAILRFAAQAPSGFNLQPWRFLVVRDAENRKRLQKAAMDQPKVGEAPVVVIFFGIREGWKQDIGPILEDGARRSGEEEGVEKTKQMATEFLEGMDPALWVNRHTMIAFTTMMLVAEAYGLDTAPMEGFDPDAVKAEFGLPEEAEVVALLAIGYGKQPDKPYTGRLPLEELVHLEHYGEQWHAEDQDQ